MVGRPAGGIESSMRGEAKAQRSLLMVGSIEERIPPKHPLRRIKKLADRALGTLSGTFDEMYAKRGRPSVPPERLLKAQLLIALFSIRSDRQFCEQLEYNLLFRWFLDMELDEATFDPSTFSHNRKRLIEHEVAEQFLAAVVQQAQQLRLLSAEHFSVDGTLIEAWASMKSFRPKDEPPGGDSNGWSNFRGTKRSNKTHESKTDPDSKLYRKGRGQAAKLSYCGSILMENRSGLAVDVDVTFADGYAERSGAQRMLKRLAGQRRRTVGADKAYDTRGFVSGCRELGVTPHVAQNSKRSGGSAIDGRTTRHAGYGQSATVRRSIEKIFGWLKSYGGWQKTRFRGRDRVALSAHLAVSAYNLLRIARADLPPQGALG